MTQLPSKINKGYLALLLVVFTIMGMYVFRDRINEQLACWAYYDQCIAQRVYGLSETDCLARTDVVAYLKTDGVCLIRADGAGVHP